MSTKLWDQSHSPGSFLSIHWFAKSGVPWMKSETGPHGGQGETEETDHSRWVGGRCNEQRNLHMGFVSCSCKMSVFLHTLIRILKVCTEALTDFSHACSPDGLNILLSQGYVLEAAASMGIAGWTYVPRVKEGVRSLWLPVSSFRFHWRSCPPNDLLQHTSTTQVNVRDRYCTWSFPAPASSWLSGPTASCSGRLTNTLPSYPFI